MQYSQPSDFRHQKLNKERVEQEIKKMNTRRWLQWSCLVFSTGLALGVFVALSYLLKIKS